MTSRLPGAALLEIGDELLSGKVADRNGPLVIKELRAVGCTLHEIRVIGDELDQIARSVRELSDRYEAVITSGGVGPTHDDVTMAGIARAFREPLVRSAPLAEAISGFYKDALNEHLLRMADLPQSAALLRPAELRVPVVLVRNIYVLPGEPSFFAKKLAAIRERFRAAPFYVRRIYTHLDEGAIAATLQETQLHHAVQVGSYPRFDNPGYAVMVTVEAKDPDAVDRAIDGILAAIPADQVARVE